MESGYLAVEVEQYSLCFLESKASDPAGPLFRLEYDLVGRCHELLWSSNNASKYISSDHKGQESGVENGFLIACNTFQRTNFLDFNELMMNSVVNSYLIVRIVLIGPKIDESALATAAKGKKGAPVVAEPTDISLAEICFPFSSLLKEKSGRSEIKTDFHSLQLNLPRTVVHPSLNPSLCNLSLCLSLDNGFLEYIAMSNLIQIEFVSVKNISREWCIPIVAPVEKSKPAAKGKGKETPSSDDLKSKEIQLITETFSNQSTLAQYILSIDYADENTDQEVNWIPFPSMNLTGGRLEFHRELCQSSDFVVSEEDPLQNHSNLFSLNWGPSGYLFFHRRTLQQLIPQLSSGSYPTLKITMKRLPPPNLSPDPPIQSKGKGEAPPEPLKELTSVASLDISSFLQPDLHGINLQTTELTGYNLELVHPICNISFHFENPFVIPSSFPSSGSLPVDAISLKQVTGSVLNRDVKKELRNEISLIVKEIAQEYVSLYPQPPSSSGETDQLMEQRKGHFLYHLSTNGIYHRLKETLKPRIQRVVRERYGARNRALGKVEKPIPSTGYAPEDKIPIEEMLSELYVLLVKECNTVLNAMYKATIVSRDTEELEKCATIDDEQETPQQKFFRLFRLASDAESDQRYQQAEQFHLERIQLLDHEILLNTDPQAPHHAYFQYHEYLLRRASETLLTHQINQFEAPMGEEIDPNPRPPIIVPEVVENLRDKAKECIHQAITLKNNHWMSYLQLGCLLLETDQIERAFDSFQTALTLQLEDTKNPNHISSNSVLNKDILHDFQGYESDKICPVHPLTYVMLSLYYSKIDQILNARKAIRLAIRSFAEGGYEPPVTSHGKPRRTGVLCLCQGANFLYEHGFINLGAICTQYAIDFDLAATKKAQERNLFSDTTPTIRHLLKKSLFYRSLYAGDLQGAYNHANECTGISIQSNDLIQSYLLLSKICSFYPDEKLMVEKRVTSYSLAIKEVAAINSYDLIPLSDYVELGKLLITQGRYQDALESMLSGCRIYPSSTLFNLIGICCLRLDKMIDAEDALQEANLIDNRNPDVWAYLCVLCLSTGGHRMEEADSCCYQSLRLGLSNSNILREIATAYIAVDKLLTAEELIRRAMACEMSENGNKPNSYTRRLLGDVLAGQNQAAQAIDEYQAVIEDDEADVQLRIQAGENCMKLLLSLGRTEELDTLESILQSLQGE